MSRDSRDPTPADTSPTIDAETRAQVKRWLDNWKVVGPILEQERWGRIVAMTDEETRKAALAVFELWEPDWPTDNGEGLVLHQRVFARARVGRR